MGLHAGDENSAAEIIFLIFPPSSDRYPLHSLHSEHDEEASGMTYGSEESRDCDEKTFLTCSLISAFCNRRPLSQ
jgi:hypothetical protein